MKKIKILDTNVFLSDPKALFSFPEELVVIPISVIDELDDFKKGQNELSRNARFVLKKIDKLRKRGQITGAKDKGIELNNRGRVIIELNHTDQIPPGLSEEKVDNRILAVASYYKKQFPDSDVSLITQDANLRIKGDAFGVPSFDYESPTNSIPDAFFKGYREEKSSVSEVNEIRKKKKMSYKGEANPNEFIILKDKNTEEVVKVVTTTDDNGEILDKEIHSLGQVRPLFGIEAINAEQVLAIDLLLDQNIPLVTITGKAGTGKTLLAIASALEQVIGEGNPSYEKILISRPVIPMGKDIGFLPGDINEKLDPWMQPIFDNLEFIFGQGKKWKTNRQDHKMLIDQGIMKVEALTYIRGRSIPNQIMIIDEAQNLTLHEVKTIITRAGKNTKLIFTGDPEQIDNPYVDSVSNGLTQIIERLKDDPLTGHIHLEKGERSPLAEMASKKLSDNR